MGCLSCRIIETCFSHQQMSCKGRFPYSRKYQLHDPLWQKRRPCRMGQFKFKFLAKDRIDVGNKCTDQGPKERIYLGFHIQQFIMEWSGPGPSDEQGDYQSPAQSKKMAGGRLFCAPAINHILFRNLFHPNIQNLAYVHLVHRLCCPFRFFSRICNCIWRKRL